jgi:hypothetical protein
MRKFYKADQVQTEGVQAAPRPRSAELRKPAALLKQRLLAVQQLAPATDEMQQRKAELRAALRPRGQCAWQGARRRGGVSSGVCCMHTRHAVAPALHAHGEWSRIRCA